MNTKQLIVILIGALIVGMVLAGIWLKISPKERYEREYSKFKDLYTEKLYQGYDLSEAENVAKNAKEAYNMEDYESAMRFLDEAIIALERAKKAAPVMLHSIWTEEDYKEFFIQDYVDLVIPPLTREQMLLIINDESVKQKSLKRLKVALEYYDEKRDKVAKSGLLHREKERVLEALDNIIGSINQLRRDINMKKGNIDVIHEDYDKFRSSTILGYQLRQELRKNFEPMYDAFIHTYKPENYHSMEFSILSESASFYSPKATSEEDIIKNIDILSDTGVDTIMIYVIYDYWMDHDGNLSNGIQKDNETINKINKAVEQIRKNNKKVSIGLFGVDKWFGPQPTHLQKVGHGKVNFETWKRTYLEMAETLVKQYDPDYVAISIEAQVVLAGQINEIRPPSDWIEITRQVADKVKEISDDTIVIVPTITRLEPIDIEFLEGIMNIKNVDVIGADVYGLSAVDSIDPLLSYWNKEKEFWIAETWGDFGGKYMDCLDDKYIIASVYYAQSKDLTGYSIFYGRHMHTKDFKKTPAFYTYKGVIEKVRNNSV